MAKKKDEESKSTTDNTAATIGDESVGATDVGESGGEQDVSSSAAAVAPELAVKVEEEASKEISQEDLLKSAKGKIALGSPTSDLTLSEQVALHAYERGKQGTGSSSKAK